MALQVKRTKQKRTFPPPKAVAPARGRRTKILEKAVAADKADQKKQMAAMRRRLKAEKKKRDEILAARQARIKAALLPLVVARDGVKALGKALHGVVLRLPGNVLSGAKRTASAIAMPIISVYRMMRDAARAVGNAVTAAVQGIIRLTVAALHQLKRAALALVTFLNPRPLISHIAAASRRALENAGLLFAQFGAGVKNAFSFLEPRRLLTYSYAAAIGVSLVIVGGQIALQVAAENRDQRATEAMASYQIANGAAAETEAAIAVLQAEPLSGWQERRQAEKNTVTMSGGVKVEGFAKSVRGMTKQTAPVRSAIVDPRVDPWVDSLAEPQAKPVPAYAPTPAWPVIAVVIDDMGMVQGQLKRFASLPAEVTFAFLPYSPDLKYQTRVMRDNGHELIVHLPMEPKRRTADPGPQALLTGLSDRELRRRIAWNLDRFEGFVGINNHMGSRFTENPMMMRAVMGALKDRNLFFLDSMTTSRSVGIPMATEFGVPQAQRDIFLDNERDYAAIMRQLRKAERIAERRGHVIAIGHPHRITYEVLKDWIPRLKRKNIRLVALSSLIRRAPTEIRIAESNVAAEISADQTPIPGRTVSSRGAVSGAGGLR